MHIVYGNRIRATGTVNSIREFLQKDSIPYEEYFDIKKEFVQEIIDFIDSLPQLYRA